MGSHHYRRYMCPFGALKIAEWLCLMVAWGTVAHEYIEADNPFQGEVTKPTFHMGIGVIAWLYVMFDFFANVCNQCHRIGIDKKHVFNAIVHFVFAGIILLAACILTNKFQGLINQKFSWHTFKAGGAFGIISSGLLVVDGVLMLCMKRNDDLNIDIHI